MEVSGQVNAPAALPEDRNIDTIHWLGFRASLGIVAKKKSCTAGK
jgi:hypothetical protein